MVALEAFDTGLRFADEPPVARAEGLNFVYGEG